MGHVILNKVRQSIHSISIEELLFCIYLIIIMGAQIILSMLSIRHFLATTYLAIGLSVFLSPIILRNVKKIKLVANEAEDNGREKLLYIVFPLVVFSIHYIAFYPGTFTTDALRQYSEAINGTYSDWHPFAHTFLAYTLPLTITGGWIGSIALLQMLCFSASISYTLITIREYTNPEFALLSMLYIMLNPQTGCNAVFVWKDVAFTMGALLLISFGLHIFMTKGRWLCSGKNTALFILVSVLTSLFRHNAILFTVPLIIVVMLHTNLKKTLIICFTYVILIFAIKGPVYSAMNVSTPGYRQVEKLGLPMTVIGAVVKDHPESLDEETKNFVFAVASEEVWNERYSYGDFNSVKRDDRTNLDVIENYGSAKIIDITFRCIRSAPLSALRGIITLTDSVYSVTDLHGGYTRPGNGNNVYGITDTGNRFLRRIIILYGYIRFLLPHVFESLGMLHLVLFAFIFTHCRFKNLRSFSKAVFLIPVFCYNYGTTLLLTGYKDAGRFFYYLFPLMPLLLVFFLGTQHIEERLSPDNTKCSEVTN